MPDFNVGGLQYFGVLSISNTDEIKITSTLTDIYNNTGFTFTGGYIASALSTFPIFGELGFNFADYNYSITLTPINVVSESNSDCPYYLIQTIVNEYTIHFLMANYQGDDYVPGFEDNSIQYYINIRLT